MVIELIPLSLLLTEVFEVKKDIIVETNEETITKINPYAIPYK